MQVSPIRYKSSIINYSVWGTGVKHVICFHGYGEDATSFEFLGTHLGDSFSFYSIELPFHGRTKWNDGLNFSSDDLVAICKEIPTLKDNNLTLLGFSLGGRACLSLYQKMPDKIERMVLLAPDGLKINSWYWLATQTWVGNKFFAFTMKHPGWFFSFLKLLNKLKLVNASIFKFVNYYIGDKEVRRLLYARWTCLRRLKPDLSLIKKQIIKNETFIRLVYGNHDRIILSSVGQKFCNAVGSNCKLIEIQSGHQVLHEKHIDELVPALLH
jgi:pimeloyl-ACP methyl ester carboxylesterase